MSWRSLGSAVVAIALTALVAIVVSGWPPNPVPTIPRGTGLGPASSPTATVAVRCVAETGPLPSFVADDPCPSAILAVEIAIAPVRLPIERIVVEPGPFFCDLIWPGVQSPAACFGPNVRPGQYMHAWASFAASPKVAAVMLGLNLPADDAAVATRPPWSSTLVAVEIPPVGWVMP